MQPVIIDDRDVDEIAYHSADPRQSHQQGHPNEQYQAGTYSPGLTGASLEFRFYGTEVAVYGVAAPRPVSSSNATPPAATLSIDGVIPITVLSDPDIQVEEYAHQFFNSHALRVGEHVLQMNITHGTAEWPFVLDYIQYTPLPDAPSNGPGSPIAAALSTTSSQKVVAAAVAASVVGLVVVVGLVAVSVRYWMRSRKTNADKGEQRLYMYHVSKSRTRSDLLDEDEKSRPCSPELAWEEAMYAGSYPPRRRRTSCTGSSNMESSVSSRPPSPAHIRPNTPSTHMHGTFACQRSLAPSTARSPPSLTRLSLSRLITPLMAAHTSGSQHPSATVCRAAIPDPLVLYPAITPPSRMGSPSLSGSSVAGGQAEKEAGYWKNHASKSKSKPANFHADSGVRSKRATLTGRHRQGCQEDRGGEKLGGKHEVEACVVRCIRDFASSAYWFIVRCSFPRDGSPEMNVTMKEHAIAS
ncbi:hypothetical protein C8Q80DRAFT_1210399 [Daedaleopsis nitida]|nr:hypothetical protein C8Q80DRAFT_1210399 [Daedaleopsis nitida]